MSRANKRLFVFLGVAIFLGLAAYGYLVEPNWIEVNHVRIQSPELSKALHGKTAVHLSDLHIGRIGKREEKVLKLLTELNPDFVFLTGDYVKWKGDYEAALAFLSKIEVKAAAWAVMGDYDYSDSRRSCLFCHEPNSGEPTKRHQIRLLRNTRETKEIEGGALLIGGIDGEGDFDPVFKEAIKEWQTQGVRIVLSHDPLNFDLFADGSEVLVLSGDTHGGQIPLPSWLWNLLGYEKNAKYSHGLYQKGMAKMYVSKGMGTSHVPSRFLRRPEIVVLHFEE
jgi:hypothetical protein